MENQQKCKRRWYQFSLRSLLIGTLICAIPCALLGRKIERKRNERNAIEAIKALGGQVFYVHEEYPPTEPPGPVWLRKLLGENFFDEIDSVELSESAITDDGVGILNSLPQLSAISARKTRISDAGLETLKGSTQVQILSLSDTGVTDAGLESLKGLPKLNSLSLSGTKVTNAGMASLKELTQLEYLDLSSTKVNDAGMTSLRGLT